MTESFIKPTEYLNPIGIRVWVISYEHTGMVIRTCVFFTRKLYGDCHPKEGFNWRYLLYLNCSVIL